MPKKLLFCFCIFLYLLSMPGISGAIENPYKNHYPFDTAIIRYKVTGYETGTETLYVKPDSKALYINTQYRYLGKMKPRKVLILTTPEYVYNIDLLKKTGSKTKNLKKDLIKEFDSLQKKEKIIVKKNVDALGTAIVGNIHAKRAPQYGKILGIDCDLVEIFGERALVWPEVNILLKNTIRSKYDDESTVIAVKIEKNVPIASEKFELPKGISLSFDKARDEILENKTMTQFHFMRDPNAIKRARVDIAREVIKKKIDLRDVEIDIPVDEDDSIFADLEVMRNVDIIIEIQNDDDDQIMNDGDALYEFE